MSVRGRLTIISDRAAVSFVAEELRELRQLAKDRRAASLVLLRKNTKPPVSPRGNGFPRKPRPMAA